MNLRKVSRITALAAATTLAWGLPTAAQATNGYLSHGFGDKAQGQAGVGIAWAQDALAAATNPAGTAEVGERLDLGLTLFRPSRSADIVGNAFGADARYSGDGKKNFYIPEIAYAHPLSPTLAAGIAVYGNGGLNTDYHTNPYGRFGAAGTAGVDLQQLFVTPSLAWKPSTDQSLGLAVNLAWQKFSAQGIGLFAGFSADPAHVSDQGNDSSTGAGLRLGWTIKPVQALSLGVTWASSIHGKFKKYSGLFANGGRFDVPENYGLGLAFTPAGAWTFGADWQSIRYSKVAAVGDSIAPLLQGVPLGAANGPGFGWKDVNVVKLAAAWRVDPTLQLRAGYSHASESVPASQTFFNILAPGVVQDHFTLGGTWSLAGGSEISSFIGLGAGKTVKGNGSIPPGNPPGGFGGGNADVRLKETILGIAYAWKP